MTIRRILILSANFFPHSTSQEQNIWLNFIHRTRGKLEKIIVVSINNNPESVEQLAGNVTFYNIHPVMLGARDQREGYFLNPRFKKVPMGQIYQTLTIRKWIPFLQELCEKEKIQVVHYLQPIGFFMKKVKASLPAGTLVSVSMSTYISRMGRLGKLYDLMKKWAIEHADVVFVPNTEVRKAAERIGIVGPSIEVVRWGLPLEKHALVEDKLQAKKAAGIKGFLLLSAGPIQEIGLGTDIEFFIDATRGIDCRKIIALKPGYRAGTQCPVPSDVEIVNTTYEGFQKYLAAADLFLSPSNNLKRTVPPPLTWLESSAVGVPVITTPIPGAEALIIHDQTGFLIETPQALNQVISNMIAFPQRLDRIRKAASNRVKTLFSIDRFCDEVIESWERKAS